MERKISTSTLLGNWKKYRTWRWRLYQLWLVLLAQKVKDYLRDWMTWNSADEWKPSKLQHYWERREYWKESWRLEETCCHSNSSERPSSNADVKNSNGNNNNNNNNSSYKERLEKLGLTTFFFERRMICDVIETWKMINWISTGRTFFNIPPPTANLPSSQILRNNSINQLIFFFLANREI